MASLLKTLFPSFFAPTSEMAETKQLNIKSFSDAIINDYFRTYLFTIDVVTPATSLKESFRAVWVASTQTPTSVTGVQNIDWMHSQVKQSGRTTVNQWEITIRDDATNYAHSYFTNWRNVVYNFKEVQAVASPSRYKRDVIVTLQSPDFNSGNSRTYTMHGVWPLQLGAVNLDYESEGISTFPVTLQYDYFEVASSANILEIL